MSELKSKHLFDLTLQLHPTIDAGVTPAGARRIVPVSGGHFAGERLRGEVLPHIGSDFLLNRADGAFQQDVRLALRTDDGAVLLMTYRGIRNGSPDVNARMARREPVGPTEYYLRTAPFFETSAPKYAWLNVILSIGIGELQPSGVLYTVFEIL